MNIVYLNKSPRIAAIEHNDKHFVKMTLEYAQMLSTAHRSAIAINEQIGYFL